MSSVPLRSNREFRLLWSGQAISQLGSQISLVAYPLLALAVTGSPAKAGLVGFALNAPIAVLALPAGMLADRVNRKHLMVTVDGVRGVALASIAVAAATGHVLYPLIVLVALIDGAGFVATYVAERGAVRRLVPREQLGEAVARNESRTFAAMLAGPPIGGLLFGLGRAVPFLVDAISYAASAVSKLLIRTDFQEPRADRAIGDAREGLRWVWQRPFFRTCMLLFAGSNPIFTGLYLLVVVLAKRSGASPAGDQRVRRRLPRRARPGPAAGARSGRVHPDQLFRRLARSARRRPPAPGRGRDRHGPRAHRVGTRAGPRRHRIAGVPSSAAVGHAHRAGPRRGVVTPGAANRGRRGERSEFTPWRSSTRW
jgi:MFS family permease